MDITWLGQTCFRLRGRDVSLLMDPFPETGLKLGALSGDIVTLSHRDPVTDQPPQAVSAIKEVRRLISGPGEYEIAGALVMGIQTFRDSQSGRVRGKNTAYMVEIDGVVVCHLGDIGHVPTATQISDMGRADILIVPIGGAGGMDVRGAIETITQISPKVVIPMRYRTDLTTAELEPVDKLLQEMGLSGVETQPRLSATPTNMPLETKVVLLEPRAGG
jgi:L-ascorbate metabolism protein UlaG (beta-lactamase superfamily)